MRERAGPEEDGKKQTGGGSDRKIEPHGWKQKGMGWWGEKEKEAEMVDGCSPL